MPFLSFSYFSPVFVIFFLFLSSFSSLSLSLSIHLLLISFFSFSFFLLYHSPFVSSFFFSFTFFVIYSSSSSTFLRHFPLLSFRPAIFSFHLSCIKKKTFFFSFLLPHFFLFPSLLIIFLFSSSFLHSSFSPTSLIPLSPQIYQFLLHIFISIFCFLISINSFSLSLSILIFPLCHFRLFANFSIALLFFYKYLFLIILTFVFHLHLFLVLYYFLLLPKFINSFSSLFLSIPFPPQIYQFIFLIFINFSSSPSLSILSPYFYRLFFVSSLILSIVLLFCYQYSYSIVLFFLFLSVFF